MAELPPELNGKIPHFVPPPGASAIYDYTFSDGFPAFKVVRFDPLPSDPDGKKRFQQWSLENDHWAPKNLVPSGQRPLYGLERLNRESGASVLVVEGEKAAQAAESLLPADWVVTTWAGGAAAVAHTDWAPISQRDVLIWPDNDGPGLKAAKAIQAQIPTAVIVDVPLKFPQSWDLADPLPEGWTEEDIRAFLGAPQKAPQAPARVPCSEPPAEAVKQIDGTLLHLSWPDEVPSVRKWIVDGIIPAATVTLLQGDGGLGKSLLTLQLAYACATKRRWLEQPTHACKVLAIYCEDEEEEIQRRLWAIIDDAKNNTPDLSGLSFSDTEDLLLVSRVGKENLLIAFDQAEGGRGETTKFLKHIDDNIAAHGAEIVILDSLHDLFGGNENNRVQVRQFVNMLQAISIDRKCAIVLNGHPSVSGMNSQTGTSGSTAWNNSVRSRLYLARDRATPDERPPFTGPLMLRIMKANYAAVGTQIELEWNNGIFRPKNLPKPGATQSLRDKKAQIDRAFLACLELAYKQNRPPQYAQNSPNAPGKMFPAMPCSEGFKSADFRTAIERLINANRIEVIERYDMSSRNVKRLLIPKKQSDWEQIPDAD